MYRYNNGHRFIDLNPGAANGPEFGTVTKISNMTAAVSLVLFMILITNAWGGEKYKHPMLFVNFNGHAKDLTGQNADPELGNSISYTTGPHGEENGAIHLDGAANSYIAWDHGEDGPLDFNNEFTYIAWWVVEVVANCGFCT